MLHSTHLDCNDFVKEDVASFAFFASFSGFFQDMPMESFYRSFLDSNLLTTQFYREHFYPLLSRPMLALRAIASSIFSVFPSLDCCI
jgi:hypothetical protein